MAPVKTCVVADSGRNATPGKPRLVDRRATSHVPWMPETSTRRGFFHGSLAAGALLLVDACSARTAGPGAASPAKHDDEPDVTAVEDMMREHGVLRRALVVYGEAATRLRSNADVPPGALHRTAELFRAFGEDYHEKKLEEAHVFPAVAGAPGLAALTAVLTAQHQRGRELTDYVLAVTAAPKVGARSAELAIVLESFVRMYEAHTAREDTVVFPAWKRALPAAKLEEMGERFEDIEHAQFGGDGFELAVRKIDAIEEELGLGDLSTFTAVTAPTAS
ncbi:MAG TPA: hemerythrin domain-containing protein [Polyangiaceae bacterium]|nr:hemerythrin domain-containing protein [Polyangiaceae bacterium]